MYRQLLTVSQVAENSAAFSEASLRWLIFNSKENGLESALVRVGRRVLIDQVRFNAWLESQRSAAATEASGRNSRVGDRGQS